MKNLLSMVCLFIWAIMATAQGVAENPGLENRYKLASYLLKPVPNIYDRQYYIIEKPVSVNEISSALNMPIDSVRQLVNKGVFVALKFYDITQSGITKENYDAYCEAIDYIFSHPDSSREKVTIDGREVKFVLFFPTIMDDDSGVGQESLTETELLRKQIWRKSSGFEGYEVLVKKGQNWLQTAACLMLSPQNIKEYNPTIRLGIFADSEYIIKIPTTPSYNGGNFAWSGLNPTQQYEILDTYAAKLISGDLNKELTMSERLKQGSNLFHYDRCQIEGEPFWHLHDFFMDVTANKISETIGIPLDTLKLYCNYAAELHDYEDDKIRFNEVAQYFLSHPDVTRKGMEDISRAMFNGCNYGLSLYIPENPMAATNGNPIIPATIKSVKTLRKFFSHKPQFKCKETGVVLTLTYSKEDRFVAYVDGKRFGKFEVDTREDHPTVALIGLSWLNGWGPAPVALYLNGRNSKCVLMPVQGEENLRYNSQGYLQHGRTGNTNWKQLSLSSDGVSFTPVDYKPSGETFLFIGFSDK